MVDMERCEDVGKRIKARRIELGLRQDEIDGVSSAWIRRIEKGEISNPRESTVIALERGIRWVPGSVERLSRGLAAEELPDRSGKAAADDGVVSVFTRLRDARLSLTDSDVSRMDDADRAALRAQAIDLRDQIDELLTQVGEEPQAD